VQPTPETAPDDLAQPQAPASGGGASPPRKPPPFGRVYLILTVVYLLGAVYGSLVPLTFRHVPFDRAVEQVVHAILTPAGRPSRVDLVANVLLFIPLTFLAMGAATQEHRRRGKLPIALALTVAACAVSLAVEFIQVYLPHRTTSRSDVIAETLGGVIGIVLWFNCGRRVTRWARHAWHDRTGDHLAARILGGYAIVVVLALLFPFDMTISPTDVWHKIKAGQITVVPFANLSQAWVYAALCRAALMAPVGYLLYLLHRRRHSGRLGVVALQGMACAALLELMQVFTYSQSAETTHIITGTLGALAGGAAAMVFGPAARYPALGSPFWQRRAVLVKLAATVAWTAGTLWEKLRPFDFAPPPGGLRAAAREVLASPFATDYGQSLVHVALSLAREFALAFVLAMLLRGLLRPATRRARAACTVLAVALAAGLELAQLGLPTRTASLGTVVIVSLAAVLGVRAMPAFVDVFLKSPAGAAAPDAPGAPSGPEGLPS